MTATDSPSLPQFHLSAGQLLITREPRIVITVLGSCVTVTMFDHGSGLAAICHTMLPRPQPAETLPPDDPGRFRYVSHAVPAMLAAYRRAGVKPHAVKVKLFGGGNVIAHRDGPFSGHSVGISNLAAARELLDAAGLIVSAENTGGHCGRKILFNTATGEVLHKPLRRVLR